MSNEKPVRITVGDVKEVAEATTIKADTVQPVSTTSTPAFRPQEVDTSGNGLVMIGGIVGLLLVIIAGYLGLTSSPEPTGGAVNAVISNNAPAGTGAVTTPAANTPAASTAANNTPDANVPATTAANNAPEVNAPAAGNTPATDANNAPK